MRLVRMLLLKKKNALDTQTHTHYFFYIPSERIREKTRIMMTIYITEDRENWNRAFRNCINMKIMFVIKAGIRPDTQQNISPS